MLRGQRLLSAFHISTQQRRSLRRYIDSSTFTLTIREHFRISCGGVSIDNHKNTYIPTWKKLGVLNFFLSKGVFIEGCGVTYVGNI